MLEDSSQTSEIHLMLEESSQTELHTSKEVATSVWEDGIRFWFGGKRFAAYLQHPLRGRGCKAVYKIDERQYNATIIKVST